MGTLIAIGIAAGIVLGLFLPWLMLFERTFVRNLLATRKREWKIFTAKQIIAEYQMVMAINAMRAAMGQHELKMDTAADQVKHSWRWKDLLHTARTSVQKAYSSIEGRWKTVQGE
jgi:hypothetical protein